MCFTCHTFTYISYFDMLQKTVTQDWSIIEVQGCLSLIIHKSTVGSPCAS